MVRTRKLSSREHCKFYFLSINLISQEQLYYQVQLADEIDRALFSRALAELKYLGMIKNSRKKADHLAKLSWKGL